MPQLAVFFRRTGVMLLFSPKILPDLDPRSKPLFLQVKRSILGMKKEAST